jgi:hypothetical protein
MASRELSPSKVDHHVRVLLEDADEEDRADERHEAEVGLERIRANTDPTPVEGGVDRIVSG